MTKEKGLKLVAKEMNDIMGLDPAINLDASDQDLYDAVLEASEMIEPDDVFSEDAWKVINALADYDPSKKGNEKGEKSKSIEKKHDDTTDIAGLVKATKKLKDLKSIVLENSVFEPLLAELDDYSGLDGARRLKNNMLVMVDSKAVSKTQSPSKLKLNSGDPVLSNKAIIWKSWKNGESDIDKLCTFVEGAVKKNTIKIWLYQWKKGKNLPAVAK